MFVGVKVTQFTTVINNSDAEPLWKGFGSVIQAHANHEVTVVVPLDPGCEHQA